MGLKDLFKSLKDKGAEAASGALGRLAGKPEGEEPTGLDSVPPPPTAPPPPGATPDVATGGPRAAQSAGNSSVSHVPGLTSQDRVPGFGTHAKGMPPGKGAPPLQVSDAEDSVYMRREGVVAEVEERYGRFGEKVCSYLLTQLMLPNGSRRIAEKLGMKSQGFDAGDRNQIEDFLDEHGTEAFAKAVGLRLTDSTATPPGGKGADPLRVRTIEARVRREGDPPSDSPAIARETPSPSHSHVPPPPAQPPLPRTATPRLQDLVPRPAPQRPQADPPSSQPGQMRSTVSAAGIEPVAIGEDALRRSHMAAAPGAPKDGDELPAPPRYPTPRPEELRRMQHEAAPPAPAAPNTANANPLAQEPPPRPASAEPPSFNPLAAELLDSALSESSRKFQFPKPT